MRETMYILIIKYPDSDEIMFRKVPYSVLEEFQKVYGESIISNIEEEYFRDGLKNLYCQ